jgi:broad specificity phosphatase PhoE
MKTTLYLVRHGQSVANLEKRALGVVDMPLSELGRRQAEATFEYMKDTHVDAIYSSPLSRAYNTILPHAKHRGMEIHTEDALKEVDHGLWEGMLESDIVKRWPYTLTEMWEKNFGVATAPGGENVQNAATRIINALKEIAERHAGQAVLVGGHGCAFRAATARMLGVAPERVGMEHPYPANASVTTVIYENGEFVVERYSESAHLSSLCGAREPKNNENKADNAFFKSANQ